MADMNISNKEHESHPLEPEALDLHPRPGRSFAAAAVKKAAGFSRSTIRTAQAVLTFDGFPDDARCLFC